MGLPLDGHCVQERRRKRSIYSVQGVTSNMKGQLQKTECSTDGEASGVLSKDI